MSVDFKPTLAPILDALVLSFIICEERRRDASRERYYDHAAGGRAFALAANNASSAAAAIAMANAANASALAASASANAACMSPPPYSGPGC